MNILYISPFSHGVNISPELHMAHLIANNGNNVHFYTVKTSYIEFADKISKVKIASLPNSVKMLYMKNYFLFPKIAYPFINPLKEYHDILSIVKCNNIDIIHFYFPEHLTCLPLFKKTNFGIPVVLSINGIPGFGWNYGDKYIDFIGKNYSKLISFKLISKADVVIPSSSQVGAILTSLGHGNVVSISDYGGTYGVNTELFRSIDKESKIKLRNKYDLPKSSFIIIYAGRFVKVKRLDLLVKSFNKLKIKTENVLLLLVGDGPEKENLINLANTYCKNQIKFVDFVEQATLSELYAASDMFVLLSSGEGNAVSLMEACSSGLPCLVSNVGAASNIITNDINGYVLDEINEMNIVNKIMAIRTNHNTFSVNARKIAIENFDWSVIINNYISLYRYLISGGGFYENINI